MAEALCFSLAVELALAEMDPGRCNKCHVCIIVTSEKLLEVLSFQDICSRAC